MAKPALHVVLLLLAGIQVLLRNNKLSLLGRSFRLLFGRRRLLLGRRGSLGRRWRRRRSSDWGLHSPIHR
jgi:hypothetical protein